MLVMTFSVGVERIHADEVQEKLMDLGIEITRRGNYKESIGESMMNPERTYFNCYAPKKRVEFLADWLENEFKPAAILSY